jgi:hypothetical protein
MSLSNTLPVQPSRALQLQPSNGKQGEVRTLAGALTLTARDEHTLLLDPDGASRTITLDAEKRGHAGLCRVIVNTGAAGEILTIQDDTPTQLDQLDGGQWGMYFLDGSAWHLTGGSNATTSFRTSVVAFEDFTDGGHLDAGKWTLNSGADAQALDAAQHTPILGGVVQLVTGDADGTVANDGSGMVWLGNPVQLDSGSGDVAVEWRVQIVSAITDISVNVGLTDSTALEEPFTGATDTITSVATDAVCFVFDDGNTTKEWFAAAVDTDVDDTGNAATGAAPVADTWQLLRLEISSDGATIRFYVDGALQTTLSGDAGVGPDVVLYPVLIANSTTTTSKTVLADLVRVEASR